MKESLKKVGFVAIILLVCFILSNVLSIPVLYKCGLLVVEGRVNWSDYFHWVIFWFITFALFANVVMSHKIAEGKVQEILFFFSAQILISEIIGYVLYSLIRCNFKFSVIDWFGCLLALVRGDLDYYGIVFLMLVLFVTFYCTVIDRRVLDFVGKGGIRGTGKLKQVEDSNLENSRWMTEEEKKKIFKLHKFSKLGEVKKDGIPVTAHLINKGRDMEVAFNSPCHSIIIGSTGSGKTTTFVSPMIQLLGASAAGSSMVITDPKGELFSMHSKFLKDRGYDVKVIDLRDTYASYRWNPLDAIWDNYEKYVNAHKLAFRRHSNVEKSGLRRLDPLESFKNVESWYEFDGCAFSDYDHLVAQIKLYKKKIFDEVYEDLNDLVTVLIPVENEKDPMWEKGARAITFAVLLAMLEDSANPENNMTKEKFNFFNLSKILQNSTNDYADLRNYFKGRSPLSKALSLSKQVCDAATQTRASYMSIVYEKLTLFNDAGICALTSSSDFRSEGLAERPTALFLKIPDEKDTRHNLAAIFILNIYKTLIKVASAKEDLTLDRNVYFIMDEFGNMPKIEKFDKFITVGRSRKIWFTMIVQSYSQLNNVYGETVADIVKGNCGIKMFIGSNDLGTCKEYSELCGNITVATTSTSGSANGETNYSTQTQVRPLIYPSELQRLNHPGDIGHSIIVTFGNFPFKTYFSPSFKVPFYKFGKMDSSEVQERFFDENKTFYDIRKRNQLIAQQNEAAENASGGKAETAAEETKAEETKAETAAETPADVSPDTTENTQTKAQQQADLLVLFAAWKEQNPDGDMQQFFAEMAASAGAGDAQEGSGNNG